MMQIIQDLIPKGRKNRPAYAMAPEYVTIHQTGNASKGANAAMHARYIKGAEAAARPASWHYTVDDHEIYQHLPLTENGWHAGDGTNGIGNRKSIAIEICINQDGNLAQAEANGAWLCAKLIKEVNTLKPFPDCLKQHYDWSGKNCPAQIRGRPGGWTGFLAAVEAQLKPTAPPAPSADRLMVITFDDFNPSDYLLAYPILKSFGIRGTSYAHTGPITAEGWRRAREMAADGWDVQCHTVSHPDMRTLTDQQIHAEMQAVNAEFISNGLPLPQHHAYPSGLYDQRVIDIVKQYRKTGRSTRADTYDGINRDTLKWYELHPIGADIKTEDDWLYLRGRLDAAYDRNRLVITIHHHTHVLDDPNPPTLSTRQDLLKRMVEYALQKGFRIVTISQLYGILTGESVAPTIPSGPLPAVVKRIGIEVNGQMTQEAGYLINNATYVRAAYLIGLAGGEVTGHGDHIKIVTKK